MAGSLRWLGPPGCEIRFPPPDTALSWPNGLLAAGGDLSPERLLAAYRQGIFPWYEAGQPILWWSPDPRAVLMPGELHVSRRLRRRLRRDPFEVSLDRNFAAIVKGCARRDRPTVGTWITAEMAAAYTALHRLGHAHSVEVWRAGRLAGGLYGVAQGRVFFAESMFSNEADASKAALVALMAELERRDFRLVDCQLPSPHLARLGSRTIPRREFLALLAAFGASGQGSGPWTAGPAPLRAPDGADAQYRGGGVH
jgi:leucyl/phenylalanyl-tRNA--protein transferase